MGEKKGERRGESLILRMWQHSVEMVAKVRISLSQLLRVSVVLLLWGGCLAAYLARCADKYRSGQARRKKPHVNLN